MKGQKKNKGKKKGQKKHKTHEKTPGKSPFTVNQNLRKKAPRRKVQVEININYKAFKGKGSNFKVFS